MEERVFNGNEKVSEKQKIEYPRNRWRMGEWENGKSARTTYEQKDGFVRGCELRVYNQNRKIIFVRILVSYETHLEVRGCVCFT